MYDMKFKRALNYLYQLQTAILCTCDSMAAEEVGKQLAVIYAPIQKLQRDSTPQSQMMRKAMNKLKTETGRESFSLKEIMDRVHKGGI